MRIAYVHDWFDHLGVTEKLRLQVACWRDQGHEVELLAVAPAGVDREAVGELAPRLYRYHDGVSRFIATTRLARDVSRLAPDLVYLRYDLFFPQVSAVVRASPTVVEINMLDEEFDLRGGVVAAYARINRRLVLGPAAGFVCVTRELARAPTLAKLEKPTVVLGNGVDLDRIDPLPAPRHSRPRLVQTGYPDHPWLGADKLVALAARLPDVDFAIVGAGSPTAALPPNVVVYPELADEALTNVLAHSDAGIGPLALHRKGLSEASPLKIREFLARGLPVILAYDDTDLSGRDDWFLLRLPNTEANVRENVDLIRGWIDRVRGRRVARDDVASSIDARPKEAARVAFMLTLAEDSLHRRPRRRRPLFGRRRVPR